MASDGTDKQTDGHNHQQCNLKAELAWGAVSVKTKSNNLDWKTSVSCRGEVTILVPPPPGVRWGCAGTSAQCTPASGVATRYSLHLHTYINTCIHLYTPAYTCIHLHTPVYTCIHLYTPVYTAVYTCIHLPTPEYTRRSPARTASTSGSV